MQSALYKTAHVPRNDPRVFFRAGQHPTIEMFAEKGSFLPFVFFSFALFAIFSETRNVGAILSERLQDRFAEREPLINIVTARGNKSLGAMFCATRRHAYQAVP